MEKELPIIKIEMSPNKFKQNENVSLRQVDLLAHTNSQIVLNLNKHEFITGAIRWVLPPSFKELENNEFNYTIIKEIDSKEIGIKQAEILFKNQHFLIDYEVLED